MRKLKKLGVIAVCMFLIYIGGTIVWELGEEKTFSVILLPKQLESENDFWEQVINGAKEASEAQEVNLEILAPSKEGNYETQKAFIIEAIKKKPDAIILAAEDYEKNSIDAQKIKEHGIKLIIIDSGIKGKIEDVMIETNNYEAGIKMGYRIKKLLVKEGTAVIMNHSKSTLTGMEREKGIRIALNDMEECIVASYDCNSNIDIAYENTINAINTYPDLKAIAALNQYTAIGVARAIKELDLSDKIKVVGFDRSIEQIKYLEEGIYDSLTIQNPFYMGYISMEKTVDLLQGEDVEAKLNIGSTVITKENMYIGMNQRLLFPF